MKILFIGDIVGRSGREALAKYLPDVINRHKPDITIVNGENAAHGSGLTPKIVRNIYELGADVVTTGNHVWGQKEIMTIIDSDKTLLRPVNLPRSNPGRGFTVVKTDAGKSVLVVNALARVFMDPVNCPFEAMDDILSQYQLGQSVDAIFLDFHGEASSEKMAMGHYLDGRVSAVVGTHTHVPTADCMIFPKGTGYMTDAGMTGDYNGVIGVKKDVPLQRFTTKITTKRMSPSDGEGSMCGVLVTVHDTTGLATAIDPIRQGPNLSTAG